MRVGYWVANWNLSRTEAARVLGGQVESMADTIAADVKPDLGPIKASSIRKVAGYVTGSPDIKWTEQDFALFPGGEFSIVTIDQDAGGDVAAAVADCEKGAKTIAQAVADAKRALEAGHEFAIYVQSSNLSAVEDEVARAGLEPGELVAYQWASPSSNPDTPLAAGVTLKQANVDLSVTVPGWHPIPHANPGHGPAAPAQVGRAELELTPEGVWTIRGAEPGIPIQTGSETWAAKVTTKNGAWDVVPLPAE